MIAIIKLVRIIFKLLADAITDLRREITSAILVGLKLFWRELARLKFLANQIHQRSGLRTKFYATNMKCGRGGQIVIPVADQEAAFEIDRPGARRLFEHARFRLSAAALDGELLD